ncbi:MAG: hypothetical protein ACRDQJ_20995, partial [Pseudonocardiaceae bacterium]
MRNGPDVLAWNSDKTYLRELAVAGVPVVPTTFLTPDDESAAPGGRWRLRGEAFGVGGQPGHGPLRRQRDTARDHAQRLLEAGRTVLVQPYQDSVDIRGA